MKLTDFLLARIAKDEANADDIHELGCELNAGEWMTTGLCDCGQPGRMRAECEAKRRIVAEYTNRDDDVDLMLGPPILRQKEWSGLRLALRVLALPYADHPDYREEWKP